MASGSGFGSVFLTIPQASDVDAVESSDWRSAKQSTMGQTRFVGVSLEPAATFIDSGALSRGEPPLPVAFLWNGASLRIAAVVKTWRSLKTDRGDDYLAKHWYEIRLEDGRCAVIYFDRKARVGRPRWWLYTIDELSE